MVYMGLEFKTRLDSVNGMLRLRDRLEIKFANLRELKLCVPKDWTPRYHLGLSEPNMEAFSVEDADESYFPEPALGISHAECSWNRIFHVRWVAAWFRSLKALSLNRERPVDWTEAPENFLRQLTALDVGGKAPYSQMPNLKSAVVDMFPEKITVHGRERDTYDFKPFFSLEEAFFNVEGCFSTFADSFLKSGGLQKLKWLGIRCKSGDVDLSIVSPGNSRIGTNEDLLADMLSLTPLLEHVTWHLFPGFVFFDKLLTVLTEFAEKNQRFKSFSVCDAEQRSPKFFRELDVIGSRSAKERGWLYRRDGGHFVFWRSCIQQPWDDVHLFPYQFFRKWGKYQ